MLLLATFAIGANVTFVSIALPATARDLGADLADALWLINGYTVVLTVLTPASGRLADRIGPRPLLLGGAVLFALAAVAAALAPNAATLIAARAVQGAGAAAVTPQALTMVVHVFPPHRRGTVLGIWGVVAGLAVAAGPAVGGLLVDTVGWRGAFAAGVVPIGAALAFARMLPNPRTAGPSRFDLKGAIVLGTALLFLVAGLLEWQRLWWAIGAGAAGLACFAAMQRKRGDAALVPPALARAGAFLLMGAVGAVLVSAVAAMTFVTAVHLQVVARLDVLTAGMVVAVPPVASLAFAPWSGRLTDRYGGRTPLLTGLWLMAGGLALLPAAAGPDRGWASLLPGLVLFGVGMGVAFAPPAALAMAHIRPDMTGAASGALNTVRMLGGALGGAAVGAVLQAVLMLRLDADDYDTAARLGPLDPALAVEFTTAVRAAYLLPAFALAAVALVCHRRLPRGMRRDAAGATRTDATEGPAVREPVAATKA
ncbi:MFS transporter [Glycomyces scopariae]